MLSALASLPDEALVPVGWIRERLAETAAPEAEPEAETEAEPQPPPVLEPNPHIVPDQLYTPYETAELLGMQSKAEDPKKRKRAMECRVCEINPRELIRGAKGGRLMFWGRDILGYIEGRRRIQEGHPNKFPTVDDLEKMARIRDSLVKDL